MSGHPYFLAPAVGDTRAGCDLKVWDLPFLAARMFVLHNSSGGERERGAHAHKEQWQAFYVVSGRAFFHLERRDGWKQMMLMYSGEDRVLVVPPLTWLTLRIHDGARVLAQASGLYDEAEYVRNRALWEAL